MNTGLGFSEMIVVVTLIIVFFGSKELPTLLREIARFTAKVRRYSDRIKRELDDVTRSLEPQPSPQPAAQSSMKQEIRTRHIEGRKALGQKLREEKSALIYEHLLSLENVRNATMIMLYAEMGAEVITRPLIRRLLAEKKRIILPYCIEKTHNFGIAEIHDIDNDLISGTSNVPEPRIELRTSFFKSDIQLIVCPCVAFDKNGARLGRGQGYYDVFLRDLRGKIPIYALAFDCQMLSEAMPFEYHDIGMDKVITESGIVVDIDKPLATDLPPLQG